MRIAYDLERLEPLLQSFLADAAPDAAFSGTHEQTFTIRGSFPADDPQAIRKLRVTGELAAARARLQGVDVTDLSLPFTLDGGVFALAEEATGTVNSGALDVGGLAIDLTTEPPTLRNDRARYVLKDVRIGPALAAQLGETAGGLFAADDAGGVLSLALGDGARVPLSAEALERGQADVTVSVADFQTNGDVLEVATTAIATAVLGGNEDAGRGANDLLRGVGELGGLLSQAGVGGGDAQKLIDELERVREITNLEAVRGFIDGGDLTLDGGVLTQDITLNLFDPRRGADNDEVFPLRLTGSVNLRDDTQDLTLLFPRSLIDRWLPDEVAELVPGEGLPVRLTGPLSAPTASLAAGQGNLFEGVVKRAVERELQKQVGKNLGDELGGVLGGGRETKPEDARRRPTPDEVIEDPGKVIEDEAKKAVERGLQNLLGGDD